MNILVRRYIKSIFSNKACYSVIQAKGYKKICVIEVSEVRIIRIFDVNEKLLYKIEGNGFLEEIWSITRFNDEQKFVYNPTNLVLRFFQSASFSIVNFNNEKIEIAIKESLIRTNLFHNGKKVGFIKKGFVFPGLMQIDDEKYFETILLVFSINFYSALAPSSGD
ncbi:MAG: hypothetical protein R2730_04400 [Chitinophagales bacterium]